MADPKLPITVELLWTSDLQFNAEAGSNGLIVDGNSKAGASPVQLLLIGLAGCMSIDVVDIIRKGRHEMIAFRSDLSGERVAESPRRLKRVVLQFHVTGQVPAHVVERAIALSRDRYCSVWHSLRQDIELVTSFDVVS